MALLRRSYCWELIPFVFNLEPVPDEIPERILQLEPRLLNSHEGSVLVAWRLLGSLDDRLCNRTDLSGDPQIMKIIAVVKFRALVLTVAGLEHANRAKRLSLVYSRLASATGDLAYRLSALFWARYAYFSFPDDVSRDSHEGRDVTDRLAVSLVAYANKYRNPLAAEEAVTFSRDAIRDCADDPNLQNWLDTSGMALRQLYAVGESESVLSEAITLTSRAFASSKLVPRRSGMASNLAPLYREKFDRARAKNISHLAIAVKLLKYSRDCQDIPYLKADYTQNLVEYLLDLHRLQGRQDDLEAAIVYATETLRLPNTNPLIDERLRNLLATALFTRFKVFDSQDDLEQSRQTFTELSRKPDMKEALQSGVMIMLSKIYMALARKNHLRADLERAKFYGKEAERYTVLSSEREPSPLWSTINIAQHYLELYRLEGDVASLIDARELAKDAIKQTDSRLSETDWSTILDTAGDIFFQMYQYNKRRYHHSLGDALDCYEKAWNLQHAKPMSRITAARKVAKVLNETPSERHYQQMWEILLNAVDLIPFACPMSMAKNDQQVLVKSLHGLSREACCAALLAKRPPFDALRVLEKGREILIQFTKKSVTELDDLRASSEKGAELADRFEELRRVINGRGVAEEDTALDQKEEIAAYSRTSAIEAMKEVTKDIQAQGGQFSHFLDAPRDEFFTELAKKGPIIPLISSDLGDFAIIVQNDIQRPIELKLSRPILKAAATRFRDLIKGKKGNGQFAKRNGAFFEMLDWLWIAVVRPILVVCRWEKARQHKRVWWMPTGEFTGLPIHLAGKWENLETWGQLPRDQWNLTPLFVVSSYATSFQTLAYARAQSNKILGRLNSKAGVGLRGLLVTMPPDRDDAGRPGIFRRSARVEQGRIERLSKTTTWKVLERPSVREVLRELPHYDIFHASCRGVPSTTNPMESCLQLFKLNDPADAKSVRNTDRLSVAAMPQDSNSRPLIVLLRACSTWHTETVPLLDEALDLRTGFQLAGCPHVIGTQWKAFSHFGDFLGSSFYHALDCCLPERLTNDLIAFSFQTAFMATIMAHKWSAVPLYWAMFCHQGP